MPSHPPINPRFPRILHGGDYNPEQWLEAPEVIDEDFRLFKEASCNVASVGIFAWAALEPQEGVYELGWMDAIMDRLAENEMFAVLATPSGAKPAWMSRAYPEIRRMNADGVREPHHDRHNHCRTSPIFREKCQLINRELARRYRDHPALLVWHVSNEYNGLPCHCPLCRAAFRDWLRERYGDLDSLNRAWWTRFWGHTYSDWEQIEPVDPTIHGLMLDWKRFNSDQTIDFFRAEVGPLREVTPQIPVTTNFMEFHLTLDYWKLARELDVVSWDSYPNYHDRRSDLMKAVRTSLAHDFHRSFLGKPFMLMESSPSVANWHPVNKLKRPGVHRLEGLQAIAHGSDSVQYFQWRKGRGGSEKFHGSVVDHFASPEARVFREVSSLGRTLAKLDAVVGMAHPAEVAILHDWENRWALEQTAGPRREGKDYVDTSVEHYQPLWQQGVACDVVNEDSDFSGYKLLVAPMLYMIRPGLAERIEAFVCAGGVFVTTYFSGIVNESDLCFQNGFPGPLRSLMGVWAEELDVLYDDESVPVLPEPGMNAGLDGVYSARLFCDLIHAESATVLARYGGEFYRTRPALTVNRVGEGKAYYIASRNDGRFHRDFYGRLIRDLELHRALDCPLPDGVTAQIRTDGQRTFVFLLGFNRETVAVDLGQQIFRDVEANETITGRVEIPPYSARILERT